MNDLVLEPTAVAQWRHLVSDAQTASHKRLDEELESYLVFLLMRFAQAPDALMRVMALEYLEALREKPKLRCERLRDVGDQCLLFSGLFPQQAQRRHVSVAYYVALGQGAYSELSSHATHNLSSMYKHLAQAFVSLMDVLQSMRRMGTHQPLLDPLQALDLWSRTGSRAALYNLTQITSSTPIIPEQFREH